MSRVSMSNPSSFHSIRVEIFNVQNLQLTTHLRCLANCRLFAAQAHSDADHALSLSPPGHFLHQTTSPAAGAPLRVIDRTHGDPPRSASFHRPALGPALQKYGRDLTADAESGLLDPLIGRRDVLQRTLQILLRRTKNNPVLIGDPGVGKTAIVEGIAQLAVSAVAPSDLRGRSIVSLDLGAIVGGTQYRGSFEERLQAIVAEVRAASGRIILFIDEIHMLVDAGRVEGGTNAANLLKPALARGELRCLGATTVEEYRRHIEPDAALARRLQPVVVEEPTEKEAVEWLKALAPRYEAHHGVRFAEGVVEAAVSAAQRFVSERKQPDSSLDVLDEAAALVHLRAAAAAAWNDAVGAAAVVVAEDQAKEGPTPFVADSLSQSPSEAAASGAAPRASDASEQWWMNGVAGEDRSPAEVKQLLEWFGAAPANPLPGFEGHRQTAAARRQTFLQQFGQGAYTDADANDVSSFHHSFVGSDGRARAVRYSQLPCPHCGTPTPAHIGDVTVTCPRCRYQFLNLPPEKLQLGASLLREEQNLMKQQQRQQRSSHGAGSTNAGGDAASPLSSTPSETALPTPTMSEAAHEIGMHASSPAEVVYVHVQDVLEVIASASRVPFERVVSAQAGWKALGHLEETLNARVIGQPSAVAATAAAVRLGVAMGAHEGRRRRPMASLLLRGPEGVGKGTLCAALAETLFGSDHALLRFDLSQATDKTAVSRLIGAAPGYVGYGEGGALTEAVRRRPHAVVCFENAHMGHPDVLAIVRQVLEDGELYDSMGRRSDFRNAIVVLIVPGTPRRVATQGSATTGLVGGTEGAVGGGPGPRPGSLNMHHQNNDHRHHQGAAAAAAMVETPEQGSNATVANKGSPSSIAFLPSEILSHVDADIEFSALDFDSLRHIASELVEDAALTLVPLGCRLVASDAALEVVVREVERHAMGAGGLHTVVRKRILGPAVDAALEQLALQQESRTGSLLVRVDCEKGDELSVSFS